MIDLHQKKQKKKPISVHHVDSELLINNHQRLFEIDCRIRLPLETKPKGEQAEHWEEFDVLRPFVHQVVAEVRRGEAYESMWLLCSCLTLLAIGLGSCATLPSEQGEPPIHFRALKNANMYSRRSLKSLRGFHISYKNPKKLPCSRSCLHCSRFKPI